MGIADRIARKFGYAPKGEMKRYYAAGNINRLTADWIFYPTTADFDVRASMQVIRSRARELVQNDPYAKAYILSCRKNIVGANGFKLTVKARGYALDINGNQVGTLDAYANSVIEQAFSDWSRKGTCEVSGKWSFRKIQSLVVTGVKRDGEIFVRLLRGSGLNKYGFALQLVEPELVDERYNAILDNGNIVRMGIELTPQRRPVAYYVKQYRPSLGWEQISVSGGPYDRIPASDMLHLYDPDRIDATRDVSPMAPAMLRMKMLSGYEEAAVINARVSACKMGFYQRQTGEGDGDPYIGDDKDVNNNPIQSAEPGQMEKLPPGWTFQEYNPHYPDNQHGPFTKAMLHGISSGLGVSYANLSSDLSDTSFASSRTGLIEEREEWKEGQQWLIENFLDPVFAGWLEMGLTMGAIGSLPLAKFDKFNAPRWSGRRWPWVDPLKDAEAMRAIVGAGFKSPQQVIAELGGDMEEVYEEQKESSDLADSLGLVFDYSISGKGAVKDNPDTGADTTEAPVSEAPAAGAPTNGSGKGNGKGAGAAA